MEMVARLAVPRGKREGRRSQDQTKLYAICRTVSLEKIEVDNMSISDLKQQRRELTAKIRAEKKAEFERVRQADLAANYVKVACPECEGTGSTWSGGADIISDPPIEDTCESCSGKAFLFARRFEGTQPKGYDLAHNEIAAPYH